MKRLVEALKRELYEVTPAERRALDILMGLASIEAARNSARIHHFSVHEPGTTEKAAASALKFVSNFDIDLGGVDETDPDAIWSAVEDHVQNAWESAAFNLRSATKLPQGDIEKMLSDLSNAISGKKTVDKGAAEKVLKRHLGESRHPPGVHEGEWSAAAERLAQDAIDSARENVDAAYAVSMVDGDVRFWKHMGESLVEDALKVLSGKTRSDFPAERDWKGYVHGVFGEVKKLSWQLVGVDKLVAGKVPTKASLVALGVPDFRVVAQRALEMGRAWAKGPGLSDMRGFAERDFDGILGDMDYRRVLPFLKGLHLGDTPPEDAVDALKADALDAGKRMAWYE